MKNSRRKASRKVEPTAWALNIGVVPVVDVDDPRQLRVASDPHACIGTVMRPEELIEQAVTSGNGWLHSARQAVVVMVADDRMSMVLVSVGEHRHTDAVVPLPLDWSTPG